MIIIKTTNGDRFINEAETLQVSHVKDKSQVEVWPSNWGHQQTIPEFFVIENVEKVIYTTAQTTAYTDVGSELEKYKQELGAQVDNYNKLKHEYLNIMQERDDLVTKLSTLESKNDPDRWWSDEADRAPVNILIGYIAKNDYCGYGVRIGTTFKDHNIKTVGDLLRIGRGDFGKYNKVGRGSLRHIDNALEMLYDIKGW